MELCGKWDKVLKICLSSKGYLLYFESKLILGLLGKRCPQYFILLNEKGASSDSTGNLNFEISFFSVALCFLLLFQHSLHLSCSNSADWWANKSSAAGDKRVVIIISYPLLGGALVLQKCFCGCWLAAGKRWVRNLGFNSQQCALSGTEGFSPIFSTYFCSPLSPLIVIFQAFHFIRSLIIYLYTTDCGQTPFLPILFPLSFLTQIYLSAAGNWKYQRNPSN